MNILILNWKDIKNPQVGGAEIIVYELAKRFIRDGNQVTWFCGNFSDGKDNETIDGIKIVRRGFSTKGVLDLFGKAVMYISAPLYYWSLKNKPDIVIDMSNTIYWQTPLWAWRSKKVAYLNQFAKEIFFYEYPPIISHFGYIVERLQYLTYYSIPFICYSNGTKKDLIDAGIDERRIYTFPLGLDHTRYIPGKKSKTPLFICVSRLVRMKKTDLVIRAMKIVSVKYPQTKLMIAGKGYERERLERLSSQLGISKSILFMDKDTWFFSLNEKDRKVRLMQEAWALVFPSVKEGWGMTVTESAASGTITIGTNVTGLKDSIIDGETGILVSSNPSVSEVANAMMKVIDNTQDRKMMEKNAILNSKKFVWENSYTEFSRIIKSI